MRSNIWVPNWSDKTDPWRLRKSESKYLSHKTDSQLFQLQSLVQTHSFQFLNKILQFQKKRKKKKTLKGYSCGKDNIQNKMTTRIKTVRWTLHQNLSNEKISSSQTEYWKQFGISLFKSRISFLILRIACMVINSPSSSFKPQLALFSLCWTSKMSKKPKTKENLSIKKN